MITPLRKKPILPRPVLSETDAFSDIHPILKRIFLARGLNSESDLDCSLKKLPSPWLLSNMEIMVAHLITAFEHQKKICVVADIDADGATSCAVAIKGLQLLGAKNVCFVVPNRFKHSYGLTPDMVNLAKEQHADILITVDNGISSVEGVDYARQMDLTVLITDHHLVGKVLPNANAIVNPNLPDDVFPSKSIAGVGVIFYVLLALRARLREKEWFTHCGIPEPNLAQLLDYVALGTVADVVALDFVNRIFVYQGLSRIKNGKAHAGIQALIDVSGKSPATLHASDLGFSLAPRLNAAGRMDDMSLGIRCLIADNVPLANDIARQLDAFNQQRRAAEQAMKQDAMQIIEDTYTFDKARQNWGICLYDKHWHQGVIGILASRIKDHFHRPVIAFAPAGEDLIKGSGRSIEGVHIRDVLSEIATENPDLIIEFGGHAMAAGLSLHTHHLPLFTLAFDEAVAKRLENNDLEQKIFSDGELSDAELNLEFAELLQNAAIWGQHFPEPVFHGQFDVVDLRVLKDQHLKMTVRALNGIILVDAIAFFVEQPEKWLETRRLLMAYRLDVNVFRDKKTLQLAVVHLEKM